MCNGTINYRTTEYFVPLLLTFVKCNFVAPTQSLCRFDFQNSYVSHFNCFAYPRSEEKPRAFRFLLVFDKRVGIVDCGVIRIYSSMHEKRSSIRWLKIEITIDLNRRRNREKRNTKSWQRYFCGQKLQNKTTKSKYKIR